MDATNTKLTICNKALAHLKARTVSSLAEQSQQAREANRFYDCERRTLLRACDWRFARVQGTLSLLGSIDVAQANPTDLSKQDIIDQFNFLYAYPPSCIRMVKVYNPYHSIFVEPYGDRHISHGAMSKFEVMRSPITNVMAIACNLEQAKCHYTVDMHDASQFDDMFQDALGWALADVLCMPLTADKELQQVVHAGAEKTLEEAKRKSMGESPEQQPRESPYTEARESGGGYDGGNHAL